MITINPLWAPIAQYNQFVLHNSQKQPLSPLTLKPANPHDPANWMSLQQAVDSANAYDCGLGFVFTDNDPFIFIDIDKAAEGNQWSALAQQLLQQFTGSYVEVSMSGTGLHIICTGNLPEHSSKNTGLNIELYHTGRYVALTGKQASGNANADMSDALPGIVQSYFPKSVATVDAQWRDTPDPRWSGPEDDNALLQKAMASKSAKAAFGTAASFADLFNANAQVLGQVYPHETEPYDRSSADAALAMSLGFWTGNNHERILRLMKMSALVRDKWTWHKSYLTMTITGAVTKRGGSDVYKQPQAQIDWNAVEPVSVPEQVMTLEPEQTSGHQFMGVQQQIEYFNDCTYVQNDHGILLPNGLILRQDQFNATYGGYEFAVTADNTKTSKKPWDVFVESQACRFPKVNTTTFDPSRPFGEIILQNSGLTTVNTFIPVVFTRSNSDPSPFLYHMQKMISDERDREIALSYLAAMLQSYDIKFQWMLILQGAQGNGKTFLTQLLQFAFGHYCYVPNVGDLAGNGFKFNEWLRGILAVVFEELHCGGKFEFIEHLKPIITNRIIEFQGKGKNQIQGNNTANILGLTNFKDAIPINDNDRRLAPIFTDQQTASDILRDMGGDHFPKLYHWGNNGGFAAITDYLLKYKIAAEFNPAGDCHRAPVTSCTREAVEISRGRVELEILEAIAHERDGFRGGWISSIALSILLKEIGAEKIIPLSKRAQLLESLGYMVHPELPGGRLSMMIPVENGKPRMYITKDHWARSLNTSIDIGHEYMRAQGHPIGIRAKKTDNTVVGFGKHDNTWGEK